MSNDLGQPAKLLLRAPAGVAIRLRDHESKLVAAGTDLLELTLPEGLYAVEWLSAGRSFEQIVRLTASASPLEILFDPALAGLETGGGPWPPPELVAKLGEGLKPLTATSRGSVAVIVAAADGLEGRDSPDIAIVNNSGKEMRVARGEVPKLPLAPEESGRCYRLAPGRHRVRYSALTGEILEQSIPVLAGRQTILFMALASADVLVPDGESFAREQRIGIDPARTLIISVDGGEEAERVRERVRLAGVLLHDLAAGTSSLSSEFESILDDPRTDPLLKLYAALVVLSRVDQGISPSTASSGEALSPGQAHHWAVRAASWIASPEIRGVPTDAAAALWHIETHHPDALHEVHKEVPGRIQAPPMLDCSWRWAIERSLLNPRAVATTSTLRAAGRSSQGSAPWLCWSPAAAKAAPARAARTGDLESLTREVAEKAERLLGPSISSDRGAALDLLNVGTLETALRAKQVTELAGEGAERSAADGLAMALQLPAAQLGRHLATANAELQTALSAQEAERAYDPPIGFAPAAALRDQKAVWESGPAPALKRRIRVPEDPNKGRFGGRPASGGFRAGAKFKRLSSDWTKIWIEVTGEAPNGTEIRFYLHDSFTPVERVARMKRGRARIEVTAWGGFTVGIWIPSVEVELELDLARVHGAPPNIRNR